jgi:putative membrane protein
MKFIAKTAASSIVAFILAKILSGIHIDNIVTAIIFCLVLALLDVIVKPILVLLTLPATVLTMGCFMFVINATVVLIASYFIKDVRIDGFWWALLFSITLSIFDTAFQKALFNDEK